MSLCFSHEHKELASQVHQSIAMRILHINDYRPKTAGFFAAIALVLFFFLWTIVPSFYYYRLHHSAAVSHLRNLDSETVAWKIPIEKSDHVAVIIEQRPLANLVPLILHFSSVLGPAWPVVVYTSVGFPISPPISRAVESGSLTIRQLPDDVELNSHSKVSEFLTTPWIWESLAPAEHVLLFQADSIICSKSQHTVEDFLEFEFIGAPIEPQYGAGYNGGLSLRRRDLMLRLSQQRIVNKESVGQFEDQWYYKKLMDLAAAGEDIKLPSVEEAVKFSVETRWGDRPLGYHQISRWHPDRMKLIFEWCPEVGLSIGGSLHKSYR